MAAYQAVKDNIDDATKQGFCAFFAALPEKPETTIRFFERNDCYTVHGTDAIFAAKEIFRTMGVIKQWGGDKLETVYLSTMVFENTLKDLLLVRQYRVELYQSKTLKGKGGQWVLVKKASPGNIQMFEEQLFQGAGMNSSSVVMAVKLTGGAADRTVGVAYCDAALGRFGVAQFPDNDQFSNFEALLVQVGARECLMSSDKGNADHLKLAQIIDRANILNTQRKKSEFVSGDLVQDLDRLLKLPQGVSASTFPEMDLVVAMDALAAVIKYLELLGNEENFAQFTLARFDSSQFMKLDGAAVRALSLTPASGESHVNKQQCISGLLNKTRTSQGSRLLLQWVLQPLLSVERINERLDMVSVFVDNQVLRMALQDEHLKRFPDLSRLAKKFQRKKATLRDAVHVYQAIKQLDGILKELGEYDGAHAVLVKEMFIDPLSRSREEFENYVKLVELTVDLEETDNREYLVKAEYDERLQAARTRMDELNAKVPKILSKAARDLDLEANKAIKVEKDGKSNAFVFRVTRNHEKLLRGNKGYKMLETLKTGVKFTTSELTAVNDEYQQLHDEYITVQEEIVAKIMGIVSTYVDAMEYLNNIIATLDVLLSFANASANAPIPYVRPEMTAMGEGGIHIVACRHPCVEVQDDVNFIANDVHFERGKSEFQIITGPNMGGKSTYIRQIGVVVLMAQIGCFVPAKSAKVSVTDAILARVGAGDRQLKGVSTFMAEMLETTSILKSATQNSLIIIDELGRGTSTYDGFGLAWAISEYIATQIKGFCLFATHFHELTALADLLPTVVNLHVDAITSHGALTLLYKLKPGVCDRSFGIHVAELAQFPEAVIEQAKRKADELEDFESTGAIAGTQSEDLKKRRVDREAGQAKIVEFLQEAEAISAKQLTPTKALEEMRALKERVLSGKNAFIQEVLGKESEVVAMSL